MILDTPSGRIAPNWSVKVGALDCGSNPRNPKSQYFLAWRDAVPADLVTKTPEGVVLA